MGVFALYQEWWWKINKVFLSNQHALAVVSWMARTSVSTGEELEIHNGVAVPEVVKIAFGGSAVWKQTRSEVTPEAEMFWLCV